jgi:hypothetical protein
LLVPGYVAGRNGVGFGGHDFSRSGFTASAVLHAIELAI